jgi:Protein of unknown function (DUF3102)
MKRVRLRASALRSAQALIGADASKDAAANNPDTPIETEPKASKSETLSDLPAVTASDEFDYGVLPREVATRARNAARRIKAQLQGTIIDTDNALLDINSALPHGTWLAWLRLEVDFDERTARNYMNAAHLAHEYCIDPSLPASVLYKLAEGRTPKAVIEEIVARAEAGERVRLSTVEVAIKRHYRSKLIDNPLPDDDNSSEPAEYQHDAADGGDDDDDDDDEQQEETPDDDEPEPDDALLSILIDLLADDPRRQTVIALAARLARRPNTAAAFLRRLSAHLAMIGP